MFSSRNLSFSWVVGPAQEKNACQEVVTKSVLRVFPGDSVHMPCDVVSGFWKHNDHPLNSCATGHYTKDGGLILLSVSFETIEKMLYLFEK